MEATIARIPQTLTLWEKTFTSEDFIPIAFPNVSNPVLKLKFMVPDHTGQISHIRRNLLCDGALCKGAKDLIHGQFFHCLDCVESIDLCERCITHPQNAHDKSHTLLSLHCRPHQPHEQSRRIVSTEHGVHDEEFLEFELTTQTLRRDFPIVWEGLDQSPPAANWPLAEGEKFKLRLKRPAQNCSVYTIAYPRDRKKLASLREFESASNPEIEYHLEFYDSLPWSHDRVVPVSNGSTPVPHPLDRSFRRVNQNSGSDECFQLARDWLQGCRSSHPECDHASVRSLPTRVLDVQGVDSTRVFLCHTANLAGEYIALSYCWGPPPKGIQTTKENLHEHQNAGLLIEDLPPTIRDAIRATQALGIKYLWADRLSIIQDDADDWAREAGRMCNIYEDAALTLSVDDSVSVWDGIFGDQNHANLKYQQLEGYPLLFRGETPHKDLDTDYDHKAPLHLRAWTLQERLMSRRILHFTSNELVWECNRKTECECRRQSSASRGRLNAKMLANKARLYDEWRVLVPEYTSRSLTVESDKLAALSGLVTRFQNLMTQVAGESDACLAGLWSGNLAAELAWLPSDGHAQSLWLKSSDGKEDPELPTNAAEIERWVAEKVSKHKRRTPETYIAPSWSWASIQGPVSYFRCYPPSPFANQINATQAAIKLKNKLQPNGPVERARLTIRGHIVSNLRLFANHNLVHIKDRTGKGPKEVCTVTCAGKYAIKFRPDDHLGAIRDYGNKSMTVKCLLLGTQDVVEIVGTPSTITMNYPEARLEALREDDTGLKELSEEQQQQVSSKESQNGGSNLLPDIFGAEEKRNLIRCSFYIILAPSVDQAGDFVRIGCFEVGKSRGSARIMRKIMEMSKWEEVTIL
ncbi:HET-domain-containing protein [Eremomyces bilateralis CBS 781.70]|uniref:HET-domain-containing protein n=1 Tax=Eremomyces bilateralis CBS 781.70 TaxID=1392243 RepID=A0A6G1FUY3_9PEZI|nr:HET-domain-containing protein [Eremomyces bilateralis CBS 781.70]KAF1809705.1 HET-domain-containing protein [Eremomyces bilateralis CBS 781.70]